MCFTFLVSASDTPTYRVVSLCVDPKWRLRLSLQTYLGSPAQRLALRLAQETTLDQGPGPEKPNFLSGSLAQAQPTLTGHGRGARVAVVKRGADGKASSLVGHRMPRGRLSVPFLFLPSSAGGTPHLPGRRADWREVMAVRQGLLASLGE